MKDCVDALINHVDTCCIQGTVPLCAQSTIIKCFSKDVQVPLVMVALVYPHSE